MRIPRLECVWLFSSRDCNSLTSNPRREEGESKRLPIGVKVNYTRKPPLSRSISCIISQFRSNWIWGLSYVRVIFDKAGRLCSSTSEQMILLMGKNAFIILFVAWSTCCFDFSIFDYNSTFNEFFKFHKSIVSLLFGVDFNWMNF